MQQILIATDFSQTAQDASTYALGLAAHLGARVELIHAYILPFAYADTPMPLVNLEEVQAISENSLRAEQDRLQKAFPGVPVSSRSVPGELMEVLKERIEQLGPDLVVLGTSGEGGAFFGSMAVKILRSCPVPVLAVPENTIWRPVQRICFAADYKTDSSLAPLIAMRRWVQLLKAQLYVFHVNAPDAPVLQVPFGLRHHLEELEPEYFSEISDNLEQTIHDFIAGRSLDWLVVLPRRYGFFERLFHRSTTKQLTLATHVPLLALQEPEVDA